MTLQKEDYKEFYKAFKNGIVDEKFMSFLPYKDALHYIFKSLDLYYLANEKNSNDFIENIVNLVTRNDNYKLIDENLIQVISNSRAGHVPKYYYEMLSSIVEPQYEANINKLVETFYLLLIDSINVWEEDAHNEKIMNPYNGVRIDKFKRLMLYIYNYNVDEIFENTSYSVSDDATKLYILCNILAYIYLNNTGYELIDNFIKDSDHYLEKLRLNGFYFEPGYNKLDKEIGKRFFETVKTFFCEQEKYVR